MVDPITGQEMAVEGEAIAPQPTIPPIDESRMVTVPGAVTPDEEKTWEIQADGQLHKLTEAQMIENASKGINYTRKTQELAPYKEMRDFIENTPGAADAIVSLMQQGVPQQQAAQMVQQQAAPTGYPQQQAQPQQQIDPNTDFLLNQMAGLQFKMESQDFQRKYPDAKFDEVAQHMLDNDLPNLDVAYRDMNYEELARKAGLSQQQITEQRQATQVEPGAQGPPDQIRVNPLELTDAQVSELRKNYNLIE